MRRPPQRAYASSLSFTTSLLALCVLGVVGAGCTPRIGDSCSTSTNCSINGDRLCDTSQPGGYCLVPDCQADRCPDDAVCVRFRSDEPRLAISFCMKGCASDGDCREGDGYRCLGPDGLPPELGIRIVDEGRGPLFCVATLPE